MATFGWLPESAQEDLPFLVYPSEYSCPEPPVLHSGSDKVVLEARLLRHTRIAGTVRDRNDQPAAGILIRAEGAERPIFIAAGIRVPATTGRMRWTSIPSNRT